MRPCEPTGGPPWRTVTGRSTTSSEQIDHLRRGETHVKARHRRMSRRTKARAGVIGLGTLAYTVGQAIGLGYLPGMADGLSKWPWWAPPSADASEADLGDTGRATALIGATRQAATTPALFDTGFAAEALPVAANAVATTAAIPVVRPLVGVPAGLPKPYPAPPILSAPPARAGVPAPGLLALSNGQTDAPTQVLSVVSPPVVGRDADPVTRLLPVVQQAPAAVDPVVDPVTAPLPVVADTVALPVVEPAVDPVPPAVEPAAEQVTAPVVEQVTEALPVPVPADTVVDTVPPDVDPVTVILPVVPSPRLGPPPGKVAHAAAPALAIPPGKAKAEDKAKDVEKVRPEKPAKPDTGSPSGQVKGATEKAKHGSKPEKAAKKAADAVADLPDGGVSLPSGTGGG